MPVDTLDALRKRREEFATALLEGIKTEKPQEIDRENKHEITKAIGGLVLDIAFTAIGGELGAAIRIPSMIKNATIIAKAIQKAPKVAGLIGKIPKIAGETAGLATSDVIQHGNVEEAVKGAIGAQVAGLGLAKASGLGYRILKRIKPLQKATEKTKNTLYSLIYSSELPRGTFEEIHREVSTPMVISSILKSEADREIAKLIKNKEDWQKMVNITKDFAKKTKIEENDATFETLSKIHRYSAHPVIVAEFIKFIERFHPELFKTHADEIARLSKEYPILFKKHDFIKYSDESMKELFALVNFDKVSELLNERIVKLKQLSQQLHELTGKKFKLEDIDKDEIKKLFIEIETTKKSISELLPYYTKEDKKNIRSLINSVSGMQRLFKTTTVKEIKHLDSLRHSMVSAIEKATQIHDSLTKNIELIGKLSETSRRSFSELDRLLRNLSSTVRRASARELFDSISPVVQQIRASVKEIAGDLSIRKLSKTEQAYINRLLKSLKEISKTNKSIVSVLSKTLIRPSVYERKLTDLFNRVLKTTVSFKDVRNAVEDLHHMYYTRITMPAKFTSRIENIKKLTLAEEDMEDILRNFQSHTSEVFSALKKRRYPLLLTKYADALREGYEIVYRTPTQNLATELTKTYMLAPAFVRIRNLLEKMAENPQYTKEVVLSGYKDLSIPIYLVTKNLEKIDVNVVKMFKPLTIADTTYYIYRPLYDAIGHAVNIATGNILNIFGKNALSQANTILKRVAVLFSFIHLKALTTAAIGIGKSKSALEAWKAFFLESHFEEKILPLIKETADKLERYNFKTTFSVNVYDDVREHFERIAAGKKIGEIIKPFLDLTDWFDRALWERMFYTLKLGTAREIIEQFEKGIISKEVATGYLDKLGSVFGGNWEWLYMKPEAREMIRLLLFAPDWYLTLIRHFTGSVKGYEMFSDFFRKIFLIHYIIANELNWSLNGKSCWDNFTETKNWKDLFRVPLYHIDPITGKRKASYISPLGFEIEGPELIGVLFFYDALIENMLTAKPFQECMSDAFVKWSKYITTKESSILRTAKNISTYFTDPQDTLIALLPKPILVNMWGKIIDRNITLTETGMKVPSHLIYILHQFGLKYHANEEISERMYNEFLLKTDRETAKQINDKFRREIKNVVDAMNESYRHISHPLKSDNPRVLYRTVIDSIVRKYIKKNYLSSIKRAVDSDDRTQLYGIQQKIYRDLEGTVLYYNYDFKSTVRRIYGQIVRNLYKEKARRTIGEEEE